MKKFTSLLTAILALSAFSFAQTYDVSCDTVFLPANGSTIDAGISSISYVRSNKGDTLKGSAGDTVRMIISIDGTIVSRVSRNMTTDFLPGASDTTGVVLNLSSLSIGQHTLCVTATIVGGKTDADSTNNTSCSTFNVAAPDLGIDSAAIVDPAMPGDSVAMGSALTSIFVRVINNGNSTYRGTVSGQTLGLPMSISIDGSNTDFTLPSTQQNPIAIPAGSSVGYTLNIGGLNLDFPSTAKTFDLCVKTSVGNDGNTANDQHCLNGLKTYNPTVSVETVEAANFNVYVSNNKLNFSYDNLNGNALFTVYDLTGKVVATETVDANGTGVHSIDADNLNGIYLVNVQMNGETVETKKVLIQ